MSSDINDENYDSYNHSLSNQFDSGYLSFSSPCRLSPSIVVFNSPISEQNNQSPINPISQKFLSKIDYENYISTRKYFDILTQLHHRNAYHLLDEILKHLSNNDLCFGLNVCKNWNGILNDYYQRKRTKNVKRNLFNSPSPIASMENIKLTSTPMRIITNRMHSKPMINSEIKEDVSSNDNIPLAASTLTFRYGYLKYLHGPTVPKRCPICGFVSIVDVHDQHGICTNPLCRNSFCQHCSGPYHPSSPCKTTIGPIRSPWRHRPSISPIFSNKTRNNLHRLLIR